MSLENIEKCLELLKQRKEWQFYFHLMQISNMIDDEMKSKESTMAKLSEIFKGMIADVRESSTKVLNAKSIAKETSDKVNTMVRDIHSQREHLSALTEKLDGLFSKMKSKKKYVQIREIEIQQTIEKIQNDIMDVNEINDQLDEVREEYRRQPLEEDCKDLREQILELEMKKYTQIRLQEKLRARQRELSDVQKTKIVERTQDELERRTVVAEVNEKYLQMAVAFKELFASYIQYQQENMNADLIEKVHSKNLITTAEYSKQLSKVVSHLRGLENQKRRVTEVTEKCYNHVMKCTGGVDPRSTEFKQRATFFKLPDNVGELDRLRKYFLRKLMQLS